ncbi:MAG: AMP-binding protein [Giesbergeria sp.]
MPITHARNVPLAASDSRFASVPARLLRTAARQPTHPAYYVRDAAGWQATNWSDYAAQVRQAARALVALGVQPGDAVCILGFNRPEWTTMDLAAMMVGGVAAGIYWSSAANEIAYIVEHSGCTVLLVENAQQWEKAACEPQALSRLRATVMMRRASTEAPAQASNGINPPMDWEAFMALGASMEHDAEVQRRLDAIKESGIATLIYTSGTTGHPKAVELTHANLSWTSAGLSAAFAVTPQDRLISYLPLAHVAEQMGAICNHVLAGYQLYFASSLETLGEHLQEVHPTIFFGVPRVWEKMQAAIATKLNAATGTKAILARWALRAGRDWHAKALQGQEPGAWLGHAKAPGGQAGASTRCKRRWVLTRRASCSPAQRPSPWKTCSSSPAWTCSSVRSMASRKTAAPPPSACRASSASELQASPCPACRCALPRTAKSWSKGPNVFVGYRSRPEATAETLQDGWLHSGDLGRIDEDGFIYVTGRKKDLLITSGGKNISPGNIEADLMNLPLVEHAVVVGDSRHYLSRAADPENRCAAELCAAAQPARHAGAMAHQPPGACRTAARRGCRQRTAGARGPHPQVQRHPGRLFHRQRLPHAHAKNPPQRGAAPVRRRD